MICARTRVSKICFDVSAYRNSTGQNRFRNREAHHNRLLWRRLYRLASSRFKLEA